MTACLYDVLGVSPDADEAGIRAAYKRAALKHHPDKATTEGPEASVERFQEVQRAYEVLIDPERRRRYDEERSAKKKEED